MRSPAFQFYPSNYLGSRAVRLMDAEQRGWYTQLLFESWESEPQATLPNDDALLRVLAGVNSRSTDVEQRWEFVKSQFKQKGKLLYNSRLLDEFVKQEENRELKRRAGKASGEARRTQREVVKTHHLTSAGSSNGSSTGVPERSLFVRTEDEQNRTLLSLTPTPSPNSTLGNTEEARTAKPRSPSTPKLCDEAYLDELQKDEAYKSLDVRHVYSKMLRVCKERGKRPTRLRLINWLNREDQPMGSNGTPKTNRGESSRTSATEAGFRGSIT